MPETEFPDTKVLSVRKVGVRGKNHSLIITIPKRFREKIKWEKGDYIEIHETKDGNLFIKKQED